MEYKEKIYILLGGLLILNLIVFIFSQRFRVSSHGDFESSGRSKFSRRQANFFIKAENIIDFDYFLIEGCSINPRHENSNSLSRRKGDSTS